MILRKAVVRTVAREVEKVAEQILKDYREGRVLDEPNITNGLAFLTEDRARKWETDGIQWYAQVLRTGRGRAAQEKKVGADLLGVIDLNLPDLEFKKGFLAQAKRAEPGARFREDDWENLITQCKRMLSNTPDSFLMLYSKRKGIRIVPALSVIHYEGRDPFQLNHRSIRRFFEDFLECFIGDKQFDSPRWVESRMKELACDTVLAIKGEEEP